MWCSRVVMKNVNCNWDTVIAQWICLSEPIKTSQWGCKEKRDFKHYHIGYIHLYLFCSGFNHQGTFFFFCQVKQKSVRVYKVFKSHFFLRVRRLLREKIKSDVQEVNSVLGWGHAKTPMESFPLNIEKKNPALCFIPLFYFLYIYIYFCLF